MEVEEPQLDEPIQCPSCKTGTLRLILGKPNPFHKGQRFPDFYGCRNYFNRAIQCKYIGVARIIRMTNE